jgi:hypothetical protein
LSIPFPDCWPATQAQRGKLLGGGRGGPLKVNSLEVEGTMLIDYCGSLYVPGRTGAIWFRIDPESFRTEALDPSPDRPPPFCWYTVSSRYGLVGGRRVLEQSPAKFFRVVVEEPKKDDTPPAQAKAPVAE